MAAGWVLEKMISKLVLLSKVNTIRLKLLIIIIVIGQSSQREHPCQGDVQEDNGSDATSYKCLAGDSPAEVDIVLLASQNTLNVHLLYNKLEFPSHTFQVFLFDGKGLADCSNVSTLSPPQCQVATGERVSYEHLLPGKYCVKVMYCLTKDRCCFYYVRYTRTEYVPGVANETTLEIVQTPAGIATSKLIYIILGVVVSLALFTGLVVLWCRKPTGQPFTKYFDNGPDRLQFVTSILTKPPVPVFLLYYPDCEHHVSVIRALAEFLGDNNCKVSYDATEKPEMVMNKVGWMAEKLGGNYKILLINSRKASAVQQEWLQNRVFRRNESVSSEVFLSALGIIMHRTKQAFDYGKLFMLRPNYVSKDSILGDICTGKRYDIPANLAVLLCHLHDLNPQDVDLEELSMSWDHCASSYTKLDSLVNGMTDYDIQGKLTMDCKQCDVRTLSANETRNLIDV